MNTKSLLKIVSITSLLILPLGCGGGGGGGTPDAGNPASVSIEIDPQEIDTGDRTNVRVKLRNVATAAIDGLLVKIRVPIEMSYRTGSAVLRRDELPDSDLTPTIADTATLRFILFFLAVDEFELTDDGDIEFVLAGRGVVEDGKVEVDVDNADQDRRANFDPAVPRFTALDDTDIDVLGDDSDSGAAASPTPASSPSS